ncbi:YdbH domain-containing protein [uncultured Sphingomonas sp.]|uniref:YdbH domain-containing protein n=1 Tax=uncultured Sphingomonas sp. TaxID=158754 RepID=UPI0025E87D36|nr:YdbH domain-containing protein [uncultured Sphingomonas sp.]
MPFVIAIVLIVILSILWLQRRPLAEGFIDRELARRGVRARYEVAEIGTSSQTLRNLVIGDPAAPDLVADEVVVRTRIGFGVPTVTGIEAGRVRLRARVVDGRLSLGSLDKLLPPPSGKAFALPELRVAIEDGRARVETPAGVIGARLSGQGRLDDGFRGRLALVSDGLSAGGCMVAGPQAALGLTIDKRVIHVTGPIRAASGGCGSQRARGLALSVDARVPEALDRWSGSTRLALAAFESPAARLSGLSGMIGFAGDAAQTEGTVALAADRAAGAPGAATGLGFDGRYRIAGSDIRLAGRARVARARPAIGAIDLRLPAGTPGASLAAGLNAAVRDATRSVGGHADLALRIAGGRGALVVRAASLTAESGAALSFAGTRGFGFGWPGNRVMVDGRLRGQGGALPAFALSLAQVRPGAPIEGRLVAQRYAVGGEALALAPVRFTRGAGGATRITGGAVADLALPGGRIDGLKLPFDLTWDGGRRLVLAPGCTPLSADRFLISSLDLRRVALRLCPTGDRLFTQGPGGFRLGTRIAAPRLAGTLGGSPIAIAAEGATVQIGRATDFALDGTEVRLGTPERLSRLSITRLTGGVVTGGAEGRFEGAAGAIGNVPIDLTQGAGTWRFVDGRLILKGETLRVADSAAEPRYEPLDANDFVLTLADGRIDATGTLTAPASGARVAGVRIEHVLASGTGDAVLSVDNLSFGDKLQPDALTKLVFGVVADVKGSVSGTGNIRWSPAGVTSDGVFRTAGTDLAAAFGPVTGLSGEIRFTDLLGLKTQSAIGTIASVNPGIPVENGQVRYQLIGEQRVAVEGGRWPFAGGELILDPTVLDLSTGKERRLTFHVEGVDAAGFLQQFDFSNLNATGTFDGTLPMIFDEKGGRIENGRLTVRQGGGTLAYVGEVSKENLGTWGNLAFGALKSLRYERLNLTLNGPLDGEMVTEIKFAGVSQGQGARSNFLIRRLARLPLVFNVTVRAPFRQLIDSVQSYYDPKRLIERNLPALLEQQKKQGVQPPASETMP